MFRHFVAVGGSPPRICRINVLTPESRARAFSFSVVGAGFAKCAAIASTRAASHRTRPRPLVIPKETMGGVAALGVALNLGGDKATHNVEKLLEALRDVRGGGGGGKA